MARPVWEPARVEIDEGPGPYDAEILVDQRWSGWVIPRFTRAVAQRVAADITTTNTAPHVHPLDAEVLRFDGDDVLLVRAPGTAEEEVLERVEPDADGRYGIGGFRWCWSRTEAAPARYRLYTLTVALLADDAPGRAAAHAYPAVASLDEVAGVHLARLGYDNADGAPAHTDVTCARDLPGEGICLRRPGHGGGCARVSDSSAAGDGGR